MYVHTQQLPLDDVLKMDLLEELTKCHPNHKTHFGSKISEVKSSNFNSNFGTGNNRLSAILRIKIGGFTDNLG